MIYYKTIENGYIVSVQMANASQGGNITESEYYSIMDKIQNKPADPKGHQYNLRADNLEWELVELPPVEQEPLTDDDALTRYANELTGANDPDLISAAETMITKLARED